MKRSIDSDLNEIERAMAAEDPASSNVTPAALPRWLRELILWATVIVVLALAFLAFLN